MFLTIRNSLLILLFPETILSTDLGDLVTRYRDAEARGLRLRPKSKCGRGAYGHEVRSLAVRPN